MLLTATLQQPAISTGRHPCGSCPCHRHSVSGGEERIGELFDMKGITRHIFIRWSVRLRGESRAMFVLVLYPSPASEEVPFFLLAIKRRHPGIPGFYLGHANCEPQRDILLLLRFICSALLSESLVILANKKIPLFIV